jgi:hypothetical protein
MESSDRQYLPSFSRYSVHHTIAAEEESKESDNSSYKLKNVVFFGAQGSVDVNSMFLRNLRNYADS